MTLAAPATLIDLMELCAPAEGSQLFARTPSGRTMSYDELGILSSAMSGVMRDSGVSTGDRVAVQVDKSVEAIALHVALLRLGAVQVPLNPAYTDNETAGLLADAEPTLVIRSATRSNLPGSWDTQTLDADGTGSLLLAAADVGDSTDDPPARLVADDPAALLYTSGTTGRPKGALLSHGNLAHNAKTLVEAWRFTGGDHLLHVLPLFHTHGLFVAVHCVLASASSMTVLPRFEVEAVLKELPRSTVLMGVPTHYTRLLDHSGFNSEVTRIVRVFISGSAPMSVAAHERFRKRIDSVVLERYGMTETSMLTSNPLIGLRKSGTVGRPLSGVQVRIAKEGDVAVEAGDVGDVQVRGPNVFHGYWRCPELKQTEFTPDGWFRTGDLGRIDRDGYLELVGRSKDLIISGGMNVYPNEVENVLDALEAVSESAVVGLPDADLGEAVVAAVVAVPGARQDGDAIRAACRARLAGFKVPKHVFFVDDLPRNAMGKVEKNRLRDELNGRDGSQSG
jgi:malonyl-CoA/methylmalonyl-CoA synthetase